MRRIVPDERARQGPRGRPVLMVLIGSLFLIGIYLTALMIWSGSQSPDDPSQEASRQAVSPSASSSNTARVPPANPAYPVPAAPPTTGTAPSSPPARQ